MKAEDFFQHRTSSERFRAEFSRELQNVKGAQRRASASPACDDEAPLVAEALGRLVRQRQLAPYLRLEAVGLLGELALAYPDALPSLLAALDDDYGFIRVAACQALGRMGPAAQAAVGPLRSAAEDRNPDVERAALKALEKICHEELAAR